MTPEDLLLKAAEIIERDGWYQGYYYEMPEGNGISGTADWYKRDHAASRTAPVCALGALRRAAYGHSSYLEGGREPRGLKAAAEKLSKLMPLTAVEREAGLEHMPISSWNDKPERTAEDVILALKQAAHSEGNTRT